MTGWEKVIVLTVGAVLVLGCLNLSLWRRMKAALRDAKERAEREGR